MSDRDLVGRGLEAFARHQWREAYEQLVEADREKPLELTDLEPAALAAFLIGRDRESTDLLMRAHQGFIAGGDPTRAARCAFWLAFGLLSKGEGVRAGGWIERARRLLDENPQDCVERGYVMIPGALRQVGEGNVPAALAAFAEVAAIGERFRDADLVTLARMGNGRALIRHGQTSQGVSLLDEAMVAVTAGELTPIIAGLVYCMVISACLDLLDLRRAHEWTEALNEWCAAQPDLVPYRGYCLVHRAEIMQLHGVWPDAMDQARQAFERLSASANKPASAGALYQLAELHRLRGEFEQAESTYRESSESGRSPHPGLALLWLAQGRADAARAAICRIADEVKSPTQRSAVLAALVEIQLACTDVEAARRAANELSGLAATLDMPFVHATATQARGAVLLAERDPGAALASLRSASELWNELDVPYAAARTRVLIAHACRQLGDADTADIELNGARAQFAQLGATHDLATLDSVSGPSAATRAGAADDDPPATAAADGLTSRELQVLQLVASGKTNRMIATALGISEKTVARHISNIFTKLDLSSRAAATAYAFQKHLV